MKTRISRITYSLEGEDESGLIPEEAARVSVDYYKNGSVKEVYFSSGKILDFEEIFSFPIEEQEEAFEQRNKEYDEISKRINPKRTRKEMQKIANLLEKSLVSE